MRTVARTGTTLLALGAATLLLGACGSDPDPSDDVRDVVAAAGDAGVAGTVEQGAAGSGDADVCALYAGDGEVLRSAYDDYGSGATDDPSALHDSLETLAADIDAVPADEVSDLVLAAAQEISAAAAAAVPALQDGAGVEEIDATVSGLETLADTCAELGLS